METLVREKIAVGKCLPVIEPSQLARQASTMLTYRRLAEEEKKDAKSNVMRAWLAEQAIDPFDRESVIRYKIERSHSEYRKHLPRNPILYVGIGGLVAGALFGSVTVMYESVDLRIIAMSVGLIGILCTLCTLAFESLSWRLSPLGTHRIYAGIIPEFALQTAIDIKTKFPDAELFVEELVPDRTVFDHLMLDPFLVLRLPDGQHLHLEVWSEPGFKQVRTV